MRIQNDLLVVITTVTDHSFRQNVLAAAAEKIQLINKVTYSNVVDADSK